MSEIEAKVKEIIVDKLGVDEADVTPEASFTNDLGADSLDILQLLMRVEDEYGIVIPDQELAGFKTVADVVNFLDKQKQ